MKRHVNIRTGTAQVTSCGGSIGDRDRIRIDSLEILPTHVILYRGPLDRERYASLTRLDASEFGGTGVAPGPPSSSAPMRFLGWPVA